ncbi:hypothetical protein [Roseivirga sp.]|uniref:hypothetical protein n=1 Tax=Roseivirga sp. TaxID=1964215 RepID=UPI003B51E324
METTDLKAIWKGHHDLLEEVPKYSIEEIHAYRKKKPVKVAKSIKATLIFSIVLKVILSLGWLSVSLLISQPWAPIASIIAVIVLLPLLGLEYRFLKRWNLIALDSSVLGCLMAQLSFMKGSYRTFIVTNALSNSLFVTLGFLLYDFQKYGEGFQIGFLTDPVLIGFIALSFIISATAQWPSYQTITYELQNNILAIEDDEAFSLQLKKENALRIRQLIIYGLLFLIGLVSLLFLAQQII